jgi:hypothetical protein
LNTLTRTHARQPQTTTTTTTTTTRGGIPRHVIQRHGTQRLALSVETIAIEITYHGVPVLSFSGIQLPTK